MFLTIQEKPFIKTSVYIPSKTESNLTKIKTSLSNSVKKITISSCEYLWSYISKVNSFARNVLNAVANNFYITCKAAKDFPKKIKNITNHMKLFSVVGVIFTAFDFKATIQKIFKHISMGDKEGIALGILTLTILASDILDAIATFVNTTLTLASANTIAAFSAMGMPLGYIMAGLGTISRVIQIAKSHSLYKKIKKEMNSENFLNKDSLKAFIEKTLGMEKILEMDKELKTLLSVPSDQLSQSQQIQIEKLKKEINKLKEKSKAAILRAAPPEAVKELETLLAMLDESSEATWTIEKMDQAFAILENVQKHLRKKMKIDVLGIVSNLILITALVLLTIGTSGSAPFIIFAVAFVVRLAALIYQNYKKV